MERCSSCNKETKYYIEEEEGTLCPSCYAELVGLTTEEIWRYIG